MKWVFALAFLVFAAPAHATPVEFKVTQRGESSFRVPRGVTQLKVIAVGERGTAGRGAEVTATVGVTAGQELVLRVGRFGASGGGGLSGVFAATPLVVAAGGGSTGDARGGVNSEPFEGVNGGGAGYPGGVDGAGGVSLPNAGRLVDAAPSLTLAYDDADAPEPTVDPPNGINAGLLSGTAGREGGDSQAVSVRFFRPGEGTVEEPASAVALGVTDGRFSTAIPFLADGEWTVQAVQTDLAGHTGYSPPVSFIFDRTGPRVQITAPGSVTNDPRVSIAGEVGDALGDLPAVDVTVTGPGVDVTVAAALDRNGFHAELPFELADGRYTALARQRDEYGHAGTSTQSFEIDTVAPSIALSGPEGDVSAPTLTGTVGEAGPVQLELLGEAGFVAATSVRPAGGAFAGTFTVPDGTYTARATLYDSAGNAGVATRRFRLDTTAPAIATSLRASYVRGEAAATGLACADEASGVAACEGPAAVDTATAGEHVLTFSARDRLGNASSTTVRYLVVSPPAATVRKAAAALKITKATRRGRTLTVKGTAAKAATGKVTVKAGSVSKTVKLARGKWTVKLRVKTARRVTATYAGDAAYLATSTSRAVR